MSPKREDELARCLAELISPACTENRHARRAIMARFDDGLPRLTDGGTS